MPFLPEPWIADKQARKRLKIEAIMRFRKLGLVFRPDGERTWCRNFAIAPTPLLRGDRLRVYFSSCDEALIGRVGYVELDARDPTRVTFINDTPVLSEGAAGCFDDNGVNVTSIVPVGRELWLYYFGYQLHQRTRYSLFGGLAVSTDDGESFVRVRETPIIDRSSGERFVRSAPFVRHDEHGFRMWYVSGNEWIDVNGKALPLYGVSYLESQDGVHWPASGKPLMSPVGEDEHGFGRPFVVSRPEGFRLWYSLRSRSRGYRIGMAESPDGISWTRLDDRVGLDVSPQGWDSEMVCYASEIALEGRTCLLYNGNGYGRDGFGIAIREA